MNTINITDYLSEEEMKEIAIEEFRARLRGNSQQDIERIASNAAYKVIWKAIDEIYDGEVDKVLKDKVIEILSDLSTFNVFAKPNAWDRAENAPYTTLCDVVKEHRGELDEKVKQSISQLTKKDMKDVAMKLVESKML